MIRLIVFKCVLEKVWVLQNKSLEVWKNNSEFGSQKLLGLDLYFKNTESGSSQRKTVRENRSVGLGKNENNKIRRSEYDLCSYIALYHNICFGLKKGQNCLVTSITTDNVNWTETVTSDFQYSRKLRKLTWDSHNVTKIIAQPSLCVDVQWWNLLVKK